MFSDLDWPLNASRGLAASAEFLVGGCDNLISFRGNIPKTPPKWEWIGNFKPNGPNIKIVISCKNINTINVQFFYRATLCVSTVFAVARCPSIRPSLCLSVTFVHSIQTVKDIVNLLCRPGSPIISFFWLPAPIPNSKGNPFCGGAIYKEGGKSLRFSTEIAIYQAFADSSHGGIVDRHVQCAQSPMHFVESATPSGSKSVALFNVLWERKSINNSNYCLQQHYRYYYVTVTSLSCKAGAKFCWNKWELINSKLNTQKSPDNKISSSSFAF